VSRVFRLFPSSHYILLATLFFIGLELVVAFHQWLLVVTGVLLGVVVYGIFLVRHEEGGRFQAVQIILPALGAVGLTGLAYFLPNTDIRHGYFAVASVLFYGLLRHGARQAYPSWNWMISMLVLFVNVAVVLGVRSNLYISLTATLIAIFAVVFLLSYQALYRVTSSARYALLLSFGLSLVMTQVSWTLQFLPFFFLVQAGIVVTFYYVVFYCLTLSLEQQLTRQRLIEYSALGLVAMAILLLSARWL
jgi:hypothetical protein